MSSVKSKNAARTRLGQPDELVEPRAVVAEREPQLGRRGAFHRGDRAAEHRAPLVDPRRRVVDGQGARDRHSHGRKRTCAVRTSIRSARVTTTVYTDGACIGNPGPGGWAWAVPDGAHASGADPQTTNQRMEIRAALEAVRALPGPLEVVSDSKYVVQCFTDRWYAKWEANGWKTSNRTPVLNQDLWRPLVEAFHEREGELTFRWVKGHSGDVMNDVVDRLATEAARRQEGRSGSEPPTGLGAADEDPRARRASVAASRPPPAIAASCSGIARPISAATATIRSRRRSGSG